MQKIPRSNNNKTMMMIPILILIMIIITFDTNCMPPSAANSDCAAKAKDTKFNRLPNNNDNDNNNIVTNNDAYLA